MFSTDTGTPGKKPPLDEVDEGEIVSTFRAKFSSSISPSTEFRTISDITLNSASSFAYISVNSTIGSKHTAEKNKLEREGDITGLLEVNVMRDRIIEIDAPR